MTDLTQRLRAAGNHDLYAFNEGADPSLCTEAADALDAKDAEIAALHRRQHEVETLATERLAEIVRLRDKLRLIELLGYREGEQMGWLVAHMRGVANDALEGRTSAHMWRLFPKHRPAALAGKE